MNSPKGAQYIDDYYYSAKFLVSTIDLSFALKVKQLFDYGFFDKLAQFDNPIYNDTIVIDNNIKNILLDICSSVKKSKDTRFNEIVKRTINDINKYHNKTLQQIKNDFQ